MIATCSRCGYAHDLSTTSAVCPVPTQNNLTQPFTCPVCSGRGKVPSGFYSHVGSDSWTVSHTTPEPCRSCSETGVVWR